MAQVSGGTVCCAIEEIDGLEYDKTPEQSMRSIFRYLTKYNRDPTNSVQAFYIFSGIVKFEAGSDDGVYDEHGTSYVMNFAKLIREQKLGILSTLPAEWNRVNHPDHKVKVYLWKPDPVRLVEWLKNGK